MADKNKGKGEETTVEGGNMPLRAGAVLSMEAQQNVREIKEGVNDLLDETKEPDDNAQLLHNISSELVKVNSTLAQISQISSQSAKVDNPVDKGDKDVFPPGMSNQMMSALYHNTKLAEANADKMDAIIKKMGIPIDGSKNDKRNKSEQEKASVESKKNAQKEAKKKEKDDLAKKIGIEFGSVIDNGLDKTLARGFKGIERRMLTQAAMVGMKLLPAIAIISGIAFTTSQVLKWLNVDLGPTIKGLSKMVSGIPDAIKRTFLGIFDAEDKAFKDADEYDEEVRASAKERIDLAKAQGVEVPKNITQSVQAVEGFEMTTEYANLAKERGGGIETLTAEEKESLREKLSRTGIIKPTLSEGWHGFGKSNDAELADYFNAVKSGSEAIKSGKTVGNKTTMEYQHAKGVLQKFDKQTGYTGKDTGMTGHRQSSQFKPYSEGNYDNNLEKFLTDAEGNEAIAQVPGKGKKGTKYEASGITLAKGLDLGRHDKKELLAMGIDKSLVEEWDGYGWIGKRGEEAQKALENNKGRKLTEQEMRQINSGARQSHEKDAIRLLGGEGVWSNLSDNQKIATTSMRYHGSLVPNGEDYSKVNAIKKGNFEEAVRLHIQWAIEKDKKDAKNNNSFEKRARKESALLLSSYSTDKHDAILNSSHRSAVESTITKEPENTSGIDTSGGSGEVIEKEKLNYQKTLNGWKVGYTTEDGKDVEVSESQEGRGYDPETGTFLRGNSDKSSDEGVPTTFLGPGTTDDRVKNAMNLKNQVWRRIAEANAKLDSEQASASPTIINNSPTIKKIEVAYHVAFDDHAII